MPRRNQRIAPSRAGRPAAAGSDAVRAKKALGQHFLVLPEIADRIADALNPWPGLPVIEVGPGMGILTRSLLQQGRDVKVVELDKESVAYLGEHFPELQGRVVEGDFLKTDLNSVFPDARQYCVIGNYPYNISTQIFFHVLEYRDNVAGCAGMLQKEVAERLAAKPGSRAGGVLSVILQTWYDVEYLFTVEPDAFNPPPKVRSGVIRLSRNSRRELPCDERRYRMVIKTAFLQRRKTLRNALKPMLPHTPEGTPLPLPENIEALMSKRAEQLTIDDFIALTLALQP